MFSWSSYVHDDVIYCDDVIYTDDRLKEDTKGSHHLMDMELADYQRAADTLQEKLNAVCLFHIFLFVVAHLGVVHMLCNEVKERGFI